MSLADPEMTYVQYLIQVGNFRLLAQLLETEDGLQDFLLSRDVHLNTCLHYVALFDDEDCIEVVLNLIYAMPELVARLKVLSEQPNAEGRSPSDFFLRGKSNSYDLLQSYLTSHSGYAGEDLS